MRCNAARGGGWRGWEEAGAARGEGGRGDEKGGAETLEGRGDYAQVSKNSTEAYG